MKITQAIPRIISTTITTIPQMCSKRLPKAKIMLPIDFRYLTTKYPARTNEIIIIMAFTMLGIDCHKFGMFSIFDKRLMSL